MHGEESERCKHMIRDCQNEVCKPSSGFFALLMAAQMCNKASSCLMGAPTYCNHPDCHIK
eukprot:scaffold20320_cov51-Prasinocladus_malaysianus.AAC.2